MSDWRRFQDRYVLDRMLAGHIASRLQQEVEKRGQTSLAVSGGTTPRQMFQLLSRCELDWSRVWITLVDERWVPPDSPDSNERLVREHLLQNYAAAAHFVPLKTPHRMPGEALTNLSERLVQVPRPFAATVLGMGTDGHTASWFPRADNLTALLDPAASEEVAATYPRTASHARATLTLAAVLESTEILIHITGEEKAAVLETAVERDYPVAAVLTQRRTPVIVFWAP